MRPINILLVRPLVPFLADSPASLQAFYRATGLTPELIANNDSWISVEKCRAAWSEAARLTGDQQLALRIAAGVPVGAFGIIEYLCRCAPSLGDAMRQFVRYVNVIDTAGKAELVLADDTARLCIVVGPAHEPGPGVRELCFALFVRQARDLTNGTVEVTSVTFSHEAPGDPAAYARWFQAPVRFGAKTCELVLPRAVLSLPLATADPTMATLLSRHADELQGLEADGITGQVQRAVRVGLSSDRAQIEDVARELGLTPRSLQRRLKDEGKTFNALRDEVRCELAKRYLGDDLSVAEISFLLGFSEPSAFFRAFKRWTGVTPQESRARRRECAP